MLILKVLDISAVDLVSVQLDSDSNIYDMVVALLSFLPGTSQECYDDELSTYLLNASRGSTQGFIHPITIQRIILTKDFMKGNAKKYINKCRKYAGTPLLIAYLGITIFYIGYNTRHPPVEALTCQGFSPDHPGINGSCVLVTYSTIL